MVLEPGQLTWLDQLQLSDKGVCFMVLEPGQLTWLDELQLSDKEVFFMF